MISITDGQIFLESNLFNSGIRPAMNAGISVSRVGGDAQIKAMKQVAGTLRLDLAQYRELVAFSQFASDLDQATQKQLSRGQRMTELLKQPQYRPQTVGVQVAVIFAGANGFLDQIPVKSVTEWESQFVEFLASKGQSTVDLLEAKKTIDDEVKGQLIELIRAFNAGFKA